MSDIPARPEGLPQTEIQLSPADLARSWLGHEGARVHRQIAQTESLLSFEEGYRPKPMPASSRPSWMEIGGMDEAIWKAEAGGYDEDDDWEDRRDTKILEYEEKIDGLHEEAAGLARNFDRVMQGDPALIERYSKLETARRERIAEKRKAQEQKAVA